jgi:hypothetical protein
LFSYISLSVLGILSSPGQTTAGIEITPHQATVYVPQCTEFHVTISPSQPSTVDISIEYSDPSRLSSVTTEFPIYPPGVSQYFSACGRVAGTDPITITAALPKALGGASSSAVVQVINALPQIAWISPDSARAGSGDIALSVPNRYNSFLPTSQISWNGVPKLTVLEYERVCPGFCSSWLRTTISAEELRLPGSASVRIVSPPPGGGESAPLTFTILPGLTENSVPTVSPLGLAVFALVLAAAGVQLLRAR